MFKTRFISGAVLVVIIALMNVIGGIFMGVCLFLIAVQGLFEFYRAVGVYKGEGTKHTELEWMGYIGTVIYYLAAIITRNDVLIKLFLIICIVLLMMLGIFVFKFPKYSGEEVMKAFFGFMYVSVMIGFIYLTRCMNNGAYIVWLIYISSWICDTCAYLFGTKFGKKKLCPMLSPNKSVEGAIGGVVGSAFLAVVFSVFYMRQFGMRSMMDPYGFMIICSIASMASQLGDIAASAFKRNNNIKDYGVIIPGHGGILDRFDSVIFTAPMIYFLAVLIIGM
ncbi:MAG: phosphatidate cytidylyltransferase [Lachnospiraceae bacterium]|nr:phosphatidate cytidylyltransferase [Lachnospiraceae bacterium]